MPQNSEPTSNCKSDVNYMPIAGCQSQFFYIFRLHCLCNVAYELCTQCTNLIWGPGPGPKLDVYILFTFVVFSPKCLFCTLFLHLSPISQSPLIACPATSRIYLFRNSAKRNKTICFIERRSSISRETNGLVRIVKCRFRSQCMTSSRGYIRERCFQRAKICVFAKASGKGRW